MKKIFIVLILAFFSCREESDLQNDQTIGLNDQKSSIVDVNYRGSKITTFKDKDGNYIVGGDMILYKDDVKELGPSIANKVNDWDQISNINILFWPNQKIYYKIGSGFTTSQIATIKSAIHEWDSKTKLDFLEVSGNEYLTFEKAATGCKANLGASSFVTNSVNSIQLSDVCDLASTVHEIGHAIGLVNEHQKGARDNYINFHTPTFDFIKNQHPLWYDGIINSVSILKSTPDDPYYFDINSVMMGASYPKSSDIYPFLIGNLLTLYNRKDGSLINNSSVLSDKDIKLVNYHYSKKLFIKNIDYPNNTIALDIKAQGYSAPILDYLSPDEYIVLIYDEAINKYTYLGHIVDRIDFNNGSSGDDLLFWQSNIVYTTHNGNTPTLINNYPLQSVTSYSTIVDPDGINGAGMSATLTAYKVNEYNTYITIKR